MSITHSAIKENAFIYIMVTHLGLCACHQAYHRCNFGDALGGGKTT
jgi:hypothetical protein